MTDEQKPTTPTEKDDRLVIPLDPEVALKALLKVDPAEMPPEESTEEPSGET
jgi:hypothetical protein